MPHIRRPSRGLLQYEHICSDVDLDCTVTVFEAWVGRVGRLEGEEAIERSVEELTPTWERLLWTVSLMIPSHREINMSSTFQKILTRVCQSKAVREDISGRPF
jgi:hypothetical protein